MLSQVIAPGKCLPTMVTFVELATHVNAMIHLSHVMDGHRSRIHDRLHVPLQLS